MEILVIKHHQLMNAINKFMITTIELLISYKASLKSDLLNNLIYLFSESTEETKRSENFSNFQITYR